MTDIRPALENAPLELFVPVPRVVGDSVYPYIIQGRVIPRSDSDFGIQVVAPPEAVAKWPTTNARFWSRVQADEMGTYGEARRLAWEEIKYFGELNPRRITVHEEEIAKRAQGEGHGR